jgi:hypothetical protein
MRLTHRVTVSISGLLAGTCTVCWSASANLVLLAHAAETHSAVFRLPSGELRSVIAGERLPDSRWNLAVVAAGEVILRDDRRLQGRIVETRLRDGDAFAPERVEDLRAKLEMPSFRPADMHPVNTVTHAPGH